jgi:hypothetical protein
MKKKIITLTILFTVAANPQNFVKSISSIKDAQREGTFLLKDGDDDPDPVMLDCASFLFGLTFELRSSKKFFQLYQSECYQAYWDIKDWTENSQRACLKADFGSWQWSLEKQADGCEASDH